MRSAAEFKIKSHANCPTFAKDTAGKINVRPGATDASVAWLELTGKRDMKKGVGYVFLQNHRAYAECRRVEGRKTCHSGRGEVAHYHPSKFMRPSGCPPRALLGPWKFRMIFLGGKSTIDYLVVEGGVAFGRQDDGTTVRTHMKCYHYDGE